MAGAPLLPEAGVGPPVGLAGQLGQGLGGRPLDRLVGARAAPVRPGPGTRPRPGCGTRHGPHGRPAGQRRGGAVGELPQGGAGPVGRGRVGVGGQAGHGRVGDRPVRAQQARQRVDPGRGRGRSWRTRPGRPSPGPRGRPSAGRRGRPPRRPGVPPAASRRAASSRSAGGVSAASRAARKPAVVGTAAAGRRRPGPARVGRPCHRDGDAGRRDEGRSGPQVPPHRRPFSPARPSPAPPPPSDAVAPGSPPRPSPRGTGRAAGRKP